LVILKSKWMSAVLASHSSPPSSNDLVYALTQLWFPWLHLDLVTVSNRILSASHSFLSTISELFVSFNALNQKSFNPLEPRTLWSDHFFHYPSYCHFPTKFSHKLGPDASLGLNQYIIAHDFPSSLSCWLNHLWISLWAVLFISFMLCLP
jgi:hypothetical protein